MRFFLNNDLKLKPIRIATILFLIFILFFWVGNFIHFWLKFNFSVTQIENYFFGSEDFPAVIPIVQILEETHINLFVFGILFLSLSALVIYSKIKDAVKIYLIIFLAFTLLLYACSDLIIIYAGREFSSLKLFTFFVYQITVLFSILISSQTNSQNSNGKRLLAVIIFIFALFNIIFVTINFFIYTEKIGLSFNGTLEYYLGNAEKFMKGKTISGLMLISTMHFIPMAVYIFTLLHFIFLLNEKYNLFLTILAFLSAFFDNLSGFLIILVSKYFAFVKLLSFFTLEILLVFCSLLIFFYLIRNKFNLN
jgi:hypothetical protein